MTNHLEYNCIFCRIVAGKEATTIIYEDDLITSFYPLTSLYRKHALIIPKAHLTDLHDMTSKAQLHLLHHIFDNVDRFANIYLSLQDYVVTINSGKEAQQEVFHLHIHVHSGS